ncbi:MAG: hypothetical protein EB154_05995 [Nitrosopumilaceae archaeon]|nr:hypothetical protein [Nitrosopumilaceae archaeon]NDF35399.1 hypothetical protein [Nitrosopumilaceae archaeon]
MKQILVFALSVIVCTIFVPHDAFAKSFSITLHESMDMSTDNKKPKDTGTKSAKKDVKLDKKEPKKTDSKKVKKLTKSKGKMLLKTKQN